MKIIFLNIISFALVLTTSSIASAQADRVERCASIGRIAATIMTARQEGAPMSTLYAAVTEDPSTPENEDERIGQQYAHEMIYAIIADAYEWDQHYTDYSRTDAVSRFRNAVEAICFRGNL